MQMSTPSYDTVLVHRFSPMQVTFILWSSPISIMAEAMLVSSSRSCTIQAPCTSSYSCILHLTTILTTSLEELIKRTLPMQESSLVLLLLYSTDNISNIKYYCNCMTEKVQAGSAQRQASLMLSTRFVHWWAGHVSQLKDNRWTKCTTRWCPQDYKQPRGHPKRCWWVDPDEAIGPNWNHVAKDRRYWTESREGSPKGVKQNPDDAYLRII